MRVVTFDFWDTLVSDHHSTTRRLYEHCLADYVEEPEEAFSRAFQLWYSTIKSGAACGPRSFASFALSPGSGPGQVRASVLGQFLDHYAQCVASGADIDVNPGVRTALSAVCARPEARAAVVTNASYVEGRSVRSMITRAGLAGQIAADAVFSSDELPWSKPDTRVFCHVAAALGVEPRHCLHVGDAPIMDVLGAARAGYNSLLFDVRRGIWSLLPDIVRHVAGT